MAFDVQGALKAGYSQQEINQYLSSKGGGGASPTSIPSSMPSSSTVQPSQDVFKQAQQTGESGVANLMRTLGGGAFADTLGLARGASNAIKGAVGMKQEDNPFFTEQQKQGFKENPIKEILSSLGHDLAGSASLAIPGGESILGRSALGGIQGGLSAASQKGADINSVLKGSALGAVLNPLIGGTLGKLSGEGLQEGGKEIMSGLTGEKISDATQTWVKEGRDIAENVLGGTKGDTPQDISMNIVKTLDETTKSIKDFLKKVGGDGTDRGLEIYNVRSGFDHEVTKAGASGLKTTDEKVKGAIEQIYSLLDKKQTNKEIGAMSPLSIFEAKQQVGDKLSQLGTFRRLNMGQEVSDAERVWLTAYKHLKDTLDVNLTNEFGKGQKISQLTEMEHQLMMANQSLHAISKVRGGGYINPRNPVGAVVQQTGMLTPAKIKLARTAYGAGQGLRGIEETLGLEKSGQIGELLRKVLMEGVTSSGTPSQTNTGQGGSFPQ